MVLFFFFTTCRWKNQDQAACTVVCTFCQKDFSGLGCFFWGERGISSRILWSTPVWTFGVSGRGMLEKSQRLFPFRPFGFPLEPLTTSELRGMWWMFALVWFTSSSTPAGGQCPAKTFGILLISLILPTFVQLTPSTINSWVLNIFLYFLPVKKKTNSFGMNTSRIYEMHFRSKLLLSVWKGAPTCRK